jgi:hypothetical protein
MWKKICQSLNVHSDSDVKNMEKLAAEQLVPDLNPFKIEIAIAKLKEV